MVSFQDSEAAHPGPDGYAVPRLLDRDNTLAILSRLTV